MTAGFRLYFDNWFTSFNLLDKLKEKQIGGTGTIRADRCLNAPLPTKKEMEKSSRGEFFQISDGNHVITKWHDNSVVSFATNCIFSKRTHSVTRFSRTEKKNVKISMLQVVHEYNYLMGGVDAFYGFLNNYRTRIRSKKWWWPFFSWCIDALVVNSWHIYKSVKT